MEARRVGTSLLVPIVHLLPSRMVERLGGTARVRREVPAELTTELPGGALEVEIRGAVWAVPGSGEYEEAVARVGTAQHYYSQSAGGGSPGSGFTSLPGFINRHHSIVDLEPGMVERPRRPDDPGHMLVWVAAGSLYPLDIGVQPLDPTKFRARDELEECVGDWYHVARRGVADDGPLGELLASAWHDGWLRLQVDWGAAKQTTANSLLLALHEFDRSVASLRQVVLGSDETRRSRPDTLIAWARLTGARA